MTKKTIKKRTINKSSIAVLNTHVEYIREAIDRIDEQVLDHIKLRDKQMEQISQNFKNIDDRIQSLEDWRKGSSESEEKTQKSKTFKLACAAFVVSTALNALVIILQLAGIL